MDDHPCGPPMFLYLHNGEEDFPHLLWDDEVKRHFYSGASDPGWYVYRRDWYKMEDYTPTGPFSGLIAALDFIKTGIYPEEFTRRLE